MKATNINKLEIRINENLKTLKNSRVINFIKSAAANYQALIEYDAEFEK